jgi:hypothetical protein
MTDGVKRRRFAFNDDTKELIYDEREDDIPEELMSKLSDYIGDGEGRVTASGSLGSSREYHKAEAFVSISLACNNDLDDAEAVHGLIVPYVRKLAAEDLLEMSKLRDPWLPPDLRLHGEVKTPPKKGPPTSLPPEEGSVKKPPKRRTSSVKTKKKGVKKPSFRR